MFDSLQAAVRDSYNDLLDRVADLDLTVTPEYHQESGATLAAIADIYKSVLTDEEIEDAELKYDNPLVYFDVPEQVRRVIELANVILVKALTEAEGPDT